MSAGCEPMTCFRSPGRVTSGALSSFGTGWPVHLGHGGLDRVDVLTIRDGKIATKRSYRKGQV
ncbi:MAG: hypothetical protein QF654_15010 [Alphaproteobacteria bacterium]|nr:hypothetical protein [Alphaproteobacteria bacterium]